MEKPDLDLMFALLLKKFGSWSALERRFKMSRPRLRYLQQNGYKVLETVTFFEEAQKELNSVDIKKRS